MSLAVLCRSEVICQSQAGIAVLEAALRRGKDSGPWLCDSDLG